MELYFVYTKVSDEFASNACSEKLMRFEFDQNIYIVYTSDSHFITGMRV